MFEKYTIAIILLFAFTNIHNKILSQQSYVGHAVSFSFPTDRVIDDFNTYHFVARDAIHLTTGFHYTASAQSFRGMIDESKLFDFVNMPSQLDADAQFNASNKVGRINGEGNVSEMGAASYSIPIEVAPGINGFVPNLAIVYNSQSGNGLLGMGWHLNGLSAITRVPKTIYHSAINLGINYQTDDYAIDGNRIIVGTDGNYHTEVETFSKFTITGTYNSPTDFIVETKEGLIYEYKYQVMAGSSVAQWLVSKILDPWGNAITFNYEQLNGEAWSTTIDYASSSVRFIYEKRSDESTMYANGSPIAQTRILKKLKTLSGNNQYREYIFNYIKQESDLYTRLVEIILKGTDGSQYNSTIINWDQTGNSLTQINTGQAAELVQNDYEVITGDYNGDGRDEFIKINKTTGAWNMYSKSISGNGLTTLTSGDFWDEGTMTIPNMANYNGFDYFKSANNFNDIDKDGKADIIITLSRKPMYFDTYIYLSSKDFANQVLVGNYNPELDNSTSTSFHGYFETLNFGGYQLGNFDNDVDDNLEIMLYGEYLGNSDIPVYIFSIHFDFSASPVSCSMVYKKTFVYSAFSNIFCIDINGNGITEICLFNNGSLRRIEYSDIENDIETNFPITTLSASINNFFPCDVNGDGYTDIITISINGSRNKIEKIMVSKGTVQAGFETLTLKTNNTTATNYYLINVCDLNNDGKTDILVESAASGAVTILFSKGQIYNSDMIFYHQDFDYCSTLVNRETYKIGDFNGDSYPDFLEWSNNSLEPNITFAFVNQNNKDKFVSKITDGMKYVTEFNYSSLAEGATQADNTLIYTNDQTPDFPLRVLNIPMYVVSEMKTTNGNASGLFATTYTYSNLHAHIQGKGILGFIANKIESPTMKIANYNNIFDTDDFCYMSLTHQIVTTSSSGNISDKIFDYSILSIGNKGYFQYPSTITEENFEHGSVTYSYVYDANGNITSEQTDFSTSDYLHTTYSSYPSSSSNLYDDKPGTITVEKKSGGETFTVTSTLTYDHGQPKTIVSKGVTITNTFDQSTGNLTQQQTSGADKTITESYTYDASHRFPVSKTNSLGTSKMIYNSFGLLLRTTDINNLTTAFSYDGFGNLKVKILPDGNSISYNMAFFSSSPVEYIVSVSPNNLSEVSTYYNLFGKPISSETAGFNEVGTISTKNEYDIFGRITDKYKPYSSALGSKWHYTYNSFGKTDIEDTPDGDKITFTYTGLETKAVSTAKGTFISTKNHFGQLLSVDENLVSTSYSYFGHGGVKKIVAPSSTINMTYDQYGFQASLNDPDAGNITYEYNVLGQLTSQSSPGETIGNPINTDMYYDDAGRCISKILNGVTYTYTYDTEFKGALSSVFSTDGMSVTYNYNRFGDVLKKTEIIAGSPEPMVTEYVYNNLHQIIKKTYPTGFAVSYSYSKEYLDEIKRAEPNHTESIWKANSYDLMKITQYQSGNNITTTQGYTNDFLTSIASVNGSTLIHNLGFTWNTEKGNLHTRTKSGVTETFGYDIMQRCTSAVATDSENNQLSDLAMDYADDGNIASKSDAGNFYYEGNPPHAIKKVTNFSAKFPLMHQTITYNAFNKAATITEGDYSMELTYGTAADRKKVVLKDAANNTVSTKYYSTDFEKTVFHSNNSTRELNYVNAPSGLCAIFVKNPVNNTDTMYYIFTDHLGSITTIANNKDNKIQRLDYDMWGNRSLANNTYSTYLFDRSYTGHEHLDAFALINMNGRMYDPLLGRFLSPDKYVQGNGSQGYNRFSYCLNNSLKYTDPTGWYSDPWGIWDYNINENPYNHENTVHENSLHNNWFGYSYPGGNNPVGDDGKEYYSDLKGLAAPEYPGIQHDQAYDEIGAVGALSLFTDPRTMIDDELFVLQEYGIAVESLFNGDLKTAGKAFLLGFGLQIAIMPKGIYAIPYSIGKKIYVESKKVKYMGTGLKGLHGQNTPFAFSKIVGNDSSVKFKKIQNYTQFLIPNNTILFSKDIIKEAFINSKNIVKSFLNNIFDLF